MYTLYHLFYFYIYLHCNSSDFNISLKLLRLHFLPIKIHFKTTTRHYTGYLLHTHTRTHIVNMCVCVDTGYSTLYSEQCIVHSVHCIVTIYVIYINLKFHCYAITVIYLNYINKHTYIHA